MKKSTRLYVLLLCWMAYLSAEAQVLISGYVTDAATGMPITSVNIAYKGQQVAIASDFNGRYVIQKEVGAALAFSAVGYVSQTVFIEDRTPPVVDIQLQPAPQHLQQTTASSQQQRYSRKNNPAVDLMREVIEGKRIIDLAGKDFYQYARYQKLTIAGSEVTPETLHDPVFIKKKRLLDQIEISPYIHKLILPVSIDESVTMRLYRRHPYDEKTVLLGQKTEREGDLLPEDVMEKMLQRDVFTDVNVYDDQIRLLGKLFVSPIGREAISTYRFYIEDTLQIAGDNCVHLRFNSMQESGLQGDIYVLKDKSVMVKRCDLLLPIRQESYGVEYVRVVQEFSQLPSGEWVMSVDDMIAEMPIQGLLQKALVMRNRRFGEYSFAPLPALQFKGKSHVRDPNAFGHSDLFWDQYRHLQPVTDHAQVRDMVRELQQKRGAKKLMAGLRMLIDNYIETGNPSKVNIGPLGSIISGNYVDGLRTRIGAETTAHLNPHWFLKGYVARGWKSHKNYYLSELTYSLNAKSRHPREFPQRTVSFSSTYDVMSPSDKFLTTDKDNLFAALKWSKVDKMMFYNRQQLTFVYQTNPGFKSTVSLKAEEDEACGNLHFVKFRTTELHADFEVTPFLRLGHTIGMKDFLGGDYHYHYTEFCYSQRFVLNTWGHLDAYVRGGVQWSRVPFPLLCMPEANLSFVLQKNTFSLVNNMEFLNDRFLSAIFSWDLNGKILHLVPLFKKWKWRECVGVKLLWGALSDKNNPLLAQNVDNSVLMPFPEGSHVMNPHTPYMEVSAGIHNIFRVLHIEYVRRLNYNAYPSAHKRGVRATLHFVF